MRAAHSIKGAARVVGVDPAVSVAHVMEDCFVAAQKGSPHLVAGGRRRPAARRGPAGQDLGGDQGPQADLANAFDGPVKSLVVELEAMLVPGARPAGPDRVAAAPAVAPSPAASGSNRSRRPPGAHADDLPARRRSPFRRSWIRRPPRRSAGNSLRDRAAVATRSGSTCGRRRTWTSRGWRSWPRSPGTSPTTVVRCIRLAGVSAEMETVLRRDGPEPVLRRPPRRGARGRVSDGNPGGRVRDPGPRTPDGSRTRPPLAGEARAGHATSASGSTAA